MHIEQLIGNLGPTLAFAVIFFIVFAESGLLFGFFFPGDSLLISAGVLAATGILNIWILVPLVFIAAVLGDSVGYWTGHKFGKKLFHKKDSLFFHKENLEKAHAFYEKHGKKTIIIARFLPFIRTFAPVVAGIADMEFKTFITYNLIGGILWAIGLSLAGYFLGRALPPQIIDKYILYAIGAVVLVTSLPTIYHVLKDADTRKSLILAAKNIVTRKKA